MQIGPFTVKVDESVPADRIVLIDPKTGKAIGAIVGINTQSAEASASVPHYCLVVGGGAPKVKHPDKATALAEAQRLADKVGQPVQVLAIVETVKPDLEAQAAKHVEKVTAHMRALLQDFDRRKGDPFFKATLLVDLRKKLEGIDQFDLEGEQVKAHNQGGAAP